LPATRSRSAAGSSGWWCARLRARGISRFWSVEDERKLKPWQRSERPSGCRLRPKANACRRERAMQARLSGRSSLTSPSRAGAGQRDRRGHPAARKSPLSVAWFLRTSCGGLLLRHPRHRVAVVFEALGVLQRILARVHDQIPLVIVLVRDLDRVEGHGDVLFAHPEKTADADDERGGLA